MIYSIFVIKILSFAGGGGSSMKIRDIVRKYIVYIRLTYEKQLARSFTEVIITR